MSSRNINLRFKEILLATSNGGKVRRTRKLIKGAGIDIVVHRPQDLDFELIDVLEDGTIEENAEQKARAYFGRVDMPILGTDTSLHIDGEDIDPLKPKRVALAGVDEKELTREEIAEKMADFWKGIARKHGGEVDGYWYDFYVLILTDGTMETADARRDIILTDTVHGEFDVSLPIRALYKDRATGKYVQLQTPEEEFIEMQPIVIAYKKLLLR